MDNNSELMDVEILGFKPNERVLLASMFKVSEMRTRAYREWQPSEKSRPDCVLIDIDDKEAKLRLDLASVRKKNSPIVTIGTITNQNANVDAHIQRPIRWAGILHTLDTVLGEIVETHSLTEPQAEEFSNRVNDLEIKQLDPWYDRNQPPKEFLTDAAVLVVDPDPVVSKFISTRLASSGYRVDHATTVTQATELIQVSRYNCIVLEMDLPDQDGIKFCKLIKQSPDKRRRTAIIILTANRNIVDRMRGSLAGCDAFLSKPVDPNNLLVTLEKFLPNWKKKSDSGI